MPDWLLALAASPRNGTHRARPASEWLRLVQGVAEGQRNDATARLCGHLLARHIHPHVALELIVAWDATRNRPPLGRTEITRVCESIAAAELRKKAGRHVGDR